MEMLLFLAESEDQTIHLFFRRSQETDQTHYKDNEAYITFYSPRVGGIPAQIAPNHFRLPLTKEPLAKRGMIYFHQKDKVTDCNY